MAYVEDLKENQDIQAYGKYGISAAEKIIKGLGESRASGFKADPNGPNGLIAEQGRYSDPAHFRNDGQDYMRFV